MPAGGNSRKKFPAYSGVHFQNAVSFKHVFENTPTPSTIFFAARFRVRKLANPLDNLALCLQPWLVLWKLNKKSGSPTMSATPVHPRDY
jgi:hypothetical protein